MQLPARALEFDLAYGGDLAQLPLEPCELQILVKCAHVPVAILGHVPRVHHPLERDADLEPEPVAAQLLQPLLLLGTERDRLESERDLRVVVENSGASLGGRVHVVSARPQVRGAEELLAIEEPGRVGVHGRSPLGVALAERQPCPPQSRHLRDTRFVRVQKAVCSLVPVQPSRRHNVVAEVGVLVLILGAPGGRVDMLDILDVSADHRHLVVNGYPVPHHIHIPLRGEDRVRVQLEAELLVLEELLLVAPRQRRPARVHRLHHPHADLVLVPAFAVRQRPLCGGEAAKLVDARLVPVICLVHNPEGEELRPGSLLEGRENCVAAARCVAEPRQADKHGALIHGQQDGLGRAQVLHRWVLWDVLNLRVETHPLPIEEDGDAGGGCDATEQQAGGSCHDHHHPRHQPTF
mmetsp:Transcript_41114/g.131536  ORF Transcript_41114/g.131536 Transcript_41114/m.131536 type:complete len:408 (+) Transcript_41114:425-1648(+)